jgi:competence protein ComEC
MTISFLPVGQGDATFIRTADAHTILIDGGPETRITGQLARVFKPEDGQIDLIILTHPHDDHVEGLREVIKNYRVGEIWETGVVCIEPDYVQFKSEAAKKNIPMRKVFAGKFIRYGDFKLTIIAPIKSYENIIVTSINNTSIVSLIEYGNFRGLLAGDAEKEEQATFLDALPNVDVLKVPHHGAANAAYESLYQKTMPQISVLTLSTSSWLVGLPSPAAINLLNKYSKHNYRTDTDGLISITTDGDKMTINTEK